MRNFPSPGVRLTLFQNTATVHQEPLDRETIVMPTKRTWFAITWKDEVVEAKAVKEKEPHQTRLYRSASRQ
jgi:hypothetical protein